MKDDSKQKDHLFKCSNGGNKIVVKLLKNIILFLILFSPLFACGTEDGIEMVQIPNQNWSIGKYEITQKEYAELMGENPAYHKGDNRPVENVSWYEAMKFCKKLTAREREAGYLPQGYKYTLPTSEQWGIACRAGTRTKYYSGNTEEDLSRVAWWRKNSGRETHPVGTKEPNAWGIYDMHGNVMEWCLDSRYFLLRVLRGGSYSDTASGCSSSIDFFDVLEDAYGDRGFRVALVPEN